MLTQADDFPVHQTPDPISQPGTDRNFYDRYFFNGFAPDGSHFFAVAFGMYPNVNLADAHFSVVVDGKQHCLHASRYLHQERMNLQVGPIRIDVLEPLKRLRVTVAPHQGIAAELLFEGRAFPIEEPRFTHRFGTRTFMDITRLTQNCRVSGWIEVDGRRIELPADSVGTRDRSWGVRPIGAPDTQPLAPPFKPSIFWTWTPLHFADTSVFFHAMADETGKAWNTRAVLCPDGAAHDGALHCDAPRIAMTLRPGTRHPASATVALPFEGRDLTLTLAPIGRFQMKGIGYGHPSWTHGTFKGELVVEREDYVLAELDPLAPEHAHVQDFCHATLREPGRPDETGFGTFELAIVGPYAPLGLS